MINEVVNYFFFSFFSSSVLALAKGFLTPFGPVIAGASHFPPTLLSGSSTYKSLNKLLYRI